MRSNVFSSGSHTTVIPEVQVGRTYKVALAWNSENEVVAFADGERRSSRFMQQGFMQSLTDLFIGGGRGSQYTIGSRIESVSLYTTRPSDAELEALTS